MLCSLSATAAVPLQSRAFSSQPHVASALLLLQPSGTPALYVGKQKLCDCRIPLGKPELRCADLSAVALDVPAQGAENDVVCACLCCLLRVWFVHVCVHVCVCTARNSPQWQTGQRRYVFALVSPAMFMEYTCECAHSKLRICIWKLLTHMILCSPLQRRLSAQIRALNCTRNTTCERLRECACRGSPASTLT